MPGHISWKLVHKINTFNHWYFVAVIVAVIPVIYAVEGNGRLNHYAAHHLFRRVQYMNKVTSGKIRDLTLTCDPAHPVDYRVPSVQLIAWALYYNPYAYLKPGVDWVDMDIRID